MVAFFPFGYYNHDYCSKEHFKIMGGKVQLRHRTQSVTHGKQINENNRELLVVFELF